MALPHCSAGPSSPARWTRRGWLLGGLALTAGIARAQPAQPTRLEKVTALARPAIGGAVRTFYSPGHEARSRELQALMSEQRAFYARSLGVEVEVTLAVLDPSDWAAAEAQLPYGIPSVSAAPHVALMPADWAQTKLGFFPAAAAAPAHLTRRVAARGLDWTRTLELGADGIIGHEFGHTLVWTYGVRAPRRWIDELLATYAGYAFMQAHRPDLVFAFDTLNALGLDARHRYSSLKDYHDKYWDILRTDSGSVQWYQAQFLERAREVHKAQGIDFLRRAKAAFPAGKGKLSDAEVMARLEALHPGWTEWGRRLEAPPEHSATAP